LSPHTVCQTRYELEAAVHLGVRDLYVHVLAAAILLYRPQAPESEDDLFKFLVGIPPSLGTVASTWLGEEPMNAIFVSGSGSALARSKEAPLTVGVTMENSSASEAVEDNAALMNSVIDTIEILGIPEDKIKTMQYSIYSNYDWELR
jgi:hypothetical protein